MPLFDLLSLFPFLVGRCERIGRGKSELGHSKQDLAALKTYSVQYFEETLKEDGTVLSHV